MKLVHSLWVGVCAFLVAINPAYSSGKKSNQPNVVLLTLDGVRWQEVFSESKDHNEAPFKLLKLLLSKEGILIGNKSLGSEMTVNNRFNLSLPGYQSLMAGTEVPCATNDCGRISVETMMERVRRELRLSKGEVATFATWSGIAKAVEHTQGSTHLVGSLNHDTETFAQALAYLEKERPRFLYISLGDADEFAHALNKKKYIDTLKMYDRWINELAGRLDAMDDYGNNTTLIVTTDHGRGSGFQWFDHGLHIPDAKYVWLYARNSKTNQVSNTDRTVLKNRPYNHSDIRPTIENLFGLAPNRCADCGRPIEELFSANVGN